jgi:hypothetical protein
MDLFPFKLNVMKSLNSFYIIGTVGMIVTAILHITLSILVVHPSLHPIFIALYPTLLTFLIIGAAQLKLATQKIPIEKQRTK